MRQPRSCWLHPLSLWSLSECDGDFTFQNKKNYFELSIVWDQSQL